ncbi:hypothetical protein [Chitinophaga pinensis]|uniref:hypothetical protein n=1 Tax=Chitinophaga pinensis TaxID=79329 RepID=UPI0028F7086A|nr:hypothetical protein [Chitinophaga pinensis]
MNYEPSSLNGLQEAPQTEVVYEPSYAAARIVRQSIDRTNNYQQAGERYRSLKNGREQT